MEALDSQSWNETLEGEVSQSLPSVLDEIKSGIGVGPRSRTLVCRDLIENPVDDFFLRGDGGGFKYPDDDLASKRIPTFATP